MYICRYCTSHVNNVNTCMRVFARVYYKGSIYISNYVDLYCVQHSQLVAACFAFDHFSNPPKRFDPNKNWWDMACCTYVRNASTSIPMLQGELKCILLTAKKEGD